MGLAYFKKQNIHSYKKKPGDRTNLDVGTTSSAHFQVHNPKKKIGDGANQDAGMGPAYVKKAKCIYFLKKKPGDRANLDVGTSSFGKNGTSDGTWAVRVA